MAAINWSVPAGDVDLITKIAERACSQGRGDATFRVLLMDIWACHANGCPLDLKGLLEADSFNFSHDVWGIYHYINRNTVTLNECFRPRYAAAQEAKQ